ncbi:hypothetical protein ACQ4PT_059855 [Festuca glaucescens]
MVSLAELEKNEQIPNELTAAHLTLTARFSAETEEFTRHTFSPVQFTAMALSLRAAASLATPPPGRRAASVVRATASPAALNTRNRRRSQNVSGEFFVDERCIDCATCRWMAPEVFKRVDGMSAVAAQPSSDEDRTKALQALLSCPTASIHTDKPARDILQVQNTFPLPIDDALPGVYLCGYHSEDSYGATSYLIIHPEGNIMVDSPRYTPRLVDKIEKLGGARYMFLTHIDDVADHRKWANELKCERIIHSGDVVDITADVEWKLTGNGPWNIGTDFELIHTPGHTEYQFLFQHHADFLQHMFWRIKRSEPLPDVQQAISDFATRQHEEVVGPRLRVVFTWAWLSSPVRRYACQEFGH